MPNSQKEAIQKTQGPCIILAGAGTGKTHTIVEKLKYLLENKTYAPQKIVCLTFSNEAANEMRKRILKILPYSPEEDKEPIIKTFHSFCSDLLKKHGEKINIPESFRILLPDDAKILLHKNLKVTPTLCHKYINEIGIAKDLGIQEEDLEDYLTKKTPNSNIRELEKTLENLQFKLQVLTLSNQHEKPVIKEKIEFLDSLIKTKKFLQTWKAYEKLKTLKNLLDYSDLNKKALELLEKNPEIAEKFQYIIIDEFQDTNKLQCDFLTYLAGKHKNITIVGDLNQSIYRFRGAYKNNIDNFSKFFKTTVKDTFALDKSYRSTNKILRVAHTLIQNNYSRKEECFPVFSALNKKESPIETFELKDGKEETRKIIEIIKSELHSSVSAEEICVIFRTHQQSRALKNSLEYEQIPYTSVTKKSLLKLTPIKITKDYLTILDKLKNKARGGEQAWWDLIYNSGFLKEDAIKISRFIKDNKKNECLSVKILNSSNSLEETLSKQGKVKLSLLLTKIKSLLSHSQKPIPELMLKIYEVSGINNSHSEDRRKSKENLLVLQKFHAFSQEYSEIDSPDLTSFLRHLEMIENLGIEIDAPSLDDSGIRIMTNHATKGLEYNTVIVTNLAQKRFPIESRKKSLIPSELFPELSDLIKDMPDQEAQEIVKKHEQHNQLLEERRLCYVAFTRAKNKLYLTYAKQYGNHKFLLSQFLNEINHKQNPDITFSQDDQEKYKEPELTPEILPAANLNPTTKTDITFSPSSLQLFDQCQKRYEYKYIYNMPDPPSISWEAMKLGSFVHTIFEEGVQANHRTEKEFIDLAKTLQMKNEWSFIELQEALPLIKIFFHRNKDKYSPNSLTEQKLNATIEGIKFTGTADRIDKNEDNSLEIIDYKTGVSNVLPKYRNWQLGFYALATQALGMGVPKFLTLDMLRHENPIVFELDAHGNANEIHSQRTSFNLEEVKQELVNTAKQILECHESGFQACKLEKNCAFCEEYVREK